MKYIDEFACKPCHSDIRRIQEILIRSLESAGLLDEDKKRGKVIRLSMSVETGANKLRIHSELIDKDTNLPIADPETVA